MISFDNIISIYFPFPDHNSEQARLARRPYQASELDQKLPLTQVAKIAVMFCFLVSEQRMDFCKLNLTDSDMKLRISMLHVWLKYV